ncbi:hypothetical protein MYSTI_06039 [Myxococcus stipitatus DSM 14675]|uniref:SnoaL-like domain-containing protein n=1 Tax=Myxococcus stipitatus (strain DSM 14675 / JCM 12634 / Mx s8) TaxID=1278073 RepID=L7UID2_MYXSD|nr:nuclear transport factor 2 family protein [Myxococcus stipitatus]AGC47312.1 hypothetical protein MYSTI_06039 [Myxococcus stipitatus DSM 14675]
MSRRTIASATALFLSLIGCAESPQKTPPAGARLPGPANIEAYPIEHLAVRSLIERFSDAMERADRKALVEMFTEDGVWEVQAPPPAISWTFKGRDAIRERLNGHERMKGKEKVVGKLIRIELREVTVSPTVIHVEGPERATASSTVEEVSHIKDTGEEVKSVGTYSDQLVKQEGQWKFARRTFIPRYDEPLPAP